MKTLQEIFNNREISLIIWLGIFATFALSQKSMRKSLFDVIKLLFGKYFLVVYVTLGIYLLGIIAILNEIGFWTNADLKDFIFWLVSVAFVLILNLNKAKESNYFKVILKDTLKAVAILEFVINFYNFGLLTELVLLPSLVFIGLLQAVSESDSKFIKVSKVLSSLMSVFGLGLLVFSVYHLIVGYSNFFRIGTLHSFLLPIILTIVFVPYLYLLSLYSIYESYFIKLDFMTVKKEKVKKVKKYILIRANINMNRLNNIMEHFAKKVFYDDTNLKKYIRKISKLNKSQTLKNSINSIFSFDFNDVPDDNYFEQGEPIIIDDKVVTTYCKSISEEFDFEQGLFGTIEIKLFAGLPNKNFIFMNEAIAFGEDEYVMLKSLVNKIHSIYGSDDQGNTDFCKKDIEDIEYGYWSKNWPDRTNPAMINYDEEDGLVLTIWQTNE